jgi:hypothetical protein
MEGARKIYHGRRVGQGGCRLHRLGDGMISECGVVGGAKTGSGTEVLGGKCPSASSSPEIPPGMEPGPSLLKAAEPARAIAPPTQRVSRVIL